MPNFVLSIISPWRGSKGDVKGSIVENGVGSITLLLAVPIPNKSQAEIW